MKRLNKVCLTLAGTVLAGLAVFGAHAAYERRLSVGVRVAITAGLDENTTLLDEKQYLRAAKLAARTKKDDYVIGLFEGFINSVEAAQDAERNATNAVFDVEQTPAAVEERDCTLDIIRGDITSDSRKACQETIKEHTAEIFAAGDRMHEQFALSHREYSIAKQDVALLCLELKVKNPLPHLGE